MQSPTTPTRPSRSTAMRSQDDLLSTVHTRQLRSAVPTPQRYGNFVNQPPRVSPRKRQVGRRDPVGTPLTMEVTGGSRKRRAPSISPSPTREARPRPQQVGIRPSITVQQPMEIEPSIEVQPPIVLLQQNGLRSRDELERDVVEVPLERVDQDSSTSRANAVGCQGRVGESQSQKVSFSSSSSSSSTRCLERNLRLKSVLISTLVFVFPLLNRSRDRGRSVLSRIPKWLPSTRSRGPRTREIDQAQCSYPRQLHLISRHSSSSSRRRTPSSSSHQPHLISGRFARPAHQADSQFHLRPTSHPNPSTPPPVLGLQVDQPTPPLLVSGLVDHPYRDGRRYLARLGFHAEVDVGGREVGVGARTRRKSWEVRGDPRKG